MVVVTLVVVETCLSMFSMFSDIQVNISASSGSSGNSSRPVLVSGAGTTAIDILGGGVCWMGVAPCAGSIAGISSFAKRTFIALLMLIFSAVLTFSYKLRLEME